MTRKPTEVVAYYRVSTQRQGRSGLGLQAQETAVREFAKREGAPIIASYTEIESGRNPDRPELRKAIGHALRSGSTLVVAKLDRLARNVAFLAALMESKVEFCCCDNPNANALTCHILAAVAEDEAKRISTRTRDALRAAKARGTKLGSARPGWAEEHGEARLRGAKVGAIRSAEARQRAASLAYVDLYDALRAWRAEGLGYRRIARRLNETSHRTTTGAMWGPATVRRVWLRARAVFQGG